MAIASVAAVVSYGVSSVVTAGVAGVIGAGIIATGVGAVAGGIASNLVKNALTPTPSSPQQTLAPEVARGLLLNSSGNVAPIPVIYGARRVGGPWALPPTVSGSGNTYLNMIVVLSEGEIEAIDTVYLDGVASTDSKFTGLVTIEKYLGTDGQAASAALIAELPALWTTDHRLAGVAYIYVRLKYSSTVWHNVPTITADVRGRKVYDPRTTLTAYSVNPALLVRDYLTNTRYGRAVPSSAIDDATFIAVANHNEEIVAIPGGTQVRYQAAGLVNPDDAMIGTLTSMLTACRGTLVFSGGKFKLIQDKAATSVFDFTADNIVGEWSVRLPGKREKMNRVRARFFNPNKEWQPDLAIQESTTYRTEDNDLVLERDVDLPFTADLYRAQQIAQIELKQSRIGIVCRFTSTIAATEVEVGDVVTITHDTPGWSAKLFRITDIELRQDDEVAITAREYDAGVYSLDNLATWTPPAETTLPDIFTVVAPSGIVVASGTDHLLRMGDGTIVSRMHVSWDAPADAFVVQTELQVKPATAATWAESILADADSLEAYASVVKDGVSYNLRLRHINAAGVKSAWTTAGPHTVVGKTEVPTDVASVSTTVIGARLLVDWPDVADADLWGYEVRLANTGWGTADANRVFIGQASSCYYAPPSPAAYTLYVKAIDTSRNYSATAASVGYTYATPANTASASASFYDTSTTSATVTLDWSDVAPDFGLGYYNVSYTKGAATISKNVNASTITLPADWIGSRTYTIKTIDARGNASTGYTLQVDKFAPASPTNFRAQVIDNTVMLYWELPAATTLPVSHALIKNGSTWAGATSLGRKDGAFTVINEIAGGTYTYWIATVDTDGNESTPISLAAKVSEPPDFVYHGSQASTFTGTCSSALVDPAGVVLPVDTTETWATHFSSRGWSTPADQVAAGYSIFIQPGAASGSYAETFDFGTVLASSKVTVSYAGATVIGTPVLTPKIETSDDAVTWVVNDGVAEAYATNFRYVRFTLTASGGTGDDLYRITALTCRCDAKQITDAGTAACLSTDASGTIVNFGRTFIDVSSITLSAQGTAPITAVYDFQDAVLTGTYSVTSNVVTVSVSAHGLIAGQRVRLNFTSGTATPDTVTIDTAATNSFTAPLTTADTSGNISIYPQSMRAYLFDAAGARASATASWSIRGY